MTDTPIERLKGCPFCGGEAEWRWHTNPECWIECSQCGAIGPQDADTTSDQNFAAWNTRATIEPIPSAGEGERAKALEEAAKVADRVLADEACKWPDVAAVEAAAETAVQIAERIRALATLPSEPLRDD